MQNFNFFAEFIFDQTSVDHPNFQSCPSIIILMKICIATYDILMGKLFSMPSVLIIK